MNIEKIFELPPARHPVKPFSPTRDTQILFAKPCPFDPEKTCCYLFKTGRGLFSYNSGLLLSPNDFNDFFGGGLTKKVDIYQLEVQAMSRFGLFQISQGGTPP